MITQAHALPAVPPASIARPPHPLAVVLGWELHRLLISRSIWIIVVSVFVVAFLMELLVGSAESVTIAADHGSRTFWLSFTNNWGLYNTLPETPGIFLGMFLPFLNVDSVARDVSRRTHELLMTTAIPSWAYLWGRYLSGLLMSIGIALVVLFAIVVQALFRHQVQPDIYVMPDVAGFTAQWAIIVLPPTTLLSSISFALGTLLPRQTTPEKLIVMLSWFVGGQMLRWATIGGMLTRYGEWDPTSEWVSYMQTTEHFLRDLTVQTHALNDQAFLTHLRTIEQQLPDMRAWIVPHLAWIVIGFAMVALITPLFHRFRNVIR